MKTRLFAVAVPAMLLLAPALAQDSGHAVTPQMVPASPVASDGRNEGPDWIRCKERRRRGDMAGIERFCLPGY